MSEKDLRLDVETRGVVDLKKTNAYVYFNDPHTALWCAAYAFGDEEPELWWPGEPCPPRIADHVLSGGLARIWNAAFEKQAWDTLLGPKHGWPVPNPRQYRCTMAQAYAMALPGKLEHAAAALGIQDQKDMVGSRLMMKMARPRSPRKNEPPGIYWHDKPEDIARLGEYCKSDVRAERGVEKRLLPLSDLEQEVFFLDMEINERGVYVDKQLCDAANKIVSVTMKKLDAEMRQVTDGEVRGVSNVSELIAFVRKRGVETDSVAKDELVNLLVRDDLPPDVYRALEIRQEGAKTSTAKINAMLIRRQTDGRMRGNMQYHGASTGRWCLTGDHEVLTLDGWERLDEWGGGLIACWAQDHETISFQEAKCLSFEYQGPLVHLVGKRINQISTPDHKMPCWSTHSGMPQIRTAGALGSAQFPYTGYRTGKRSFPDDLSLRILVMVQADGHYTTEDRTLRFHFSKERKIARCKHLLRQAGIYYREHKESKATAIVIPNRCLPTWLRTFENKTFGWWLLRTDLDVLFDELERWDGYRCGPRSIQYCTTNKENADIIQTCAHISGRSACIVVKHDRDKNWNTAYYVNVWLAPGNRANLRHKPAVIDSNEKIKVYCAETPTGAFLVRRQRLIWVTGNSGRGAQLQNQPRPSIKTSAIGPVIEDVLTGNADLVELLHGPPMSVVSDCIRSMIAAEPDA